MRRVGCLRYRCDVVSGSEKTRMLLDVGKSVEEMQGSRETKRNMI